MRPHTYRLIYVPSSQPVPQLRTLPRLLHAENDKFHFHPPLATAIIRNTDVEIWLREDDLDVSIVSRSSRLFPQLFLMRLLFFKVTFESSGPFGLRSAALVFQLSRLVGRSVIPSVVFVKSIFSQLYCMCMHVCFIKRQVSDVRFMNIY